MSAQIREYEHELPRLAIRETWGQALYRQDDKTLGK